MFRLNMSHYIFKFSEFGKIIMDDFLSTPVARAGPTSRLLKRRSSIPEPKSNKACYLSLESSVFSYEHIRFMDWNNFIFSSLFI